MKKPAKSTAQTDAAKAKKKAAPKARKAPTKDAA